MALTKKGFEARRQLAETRKRKLEKAKSLGWAEGDPYSAEEIIALHDKHCLLVRDHVLNYAPGGALWQRIQGHVADLSWAPVLRMVDDAFDESRANSEEAFNDLLKRIGAYIALAIRDDNAELFHQIHVVLKHRRDGKDLRELKPKDLGIKAKRGRKPSTYDLSRIFPIALADVTGARLKDYPPLEQFTKERISRAEVKAVVANLGGTISESELSRQLKAFEFSRFMAEQPIARKRSKEDS